jgi:flagellar biosynthesis/type III secretory pathway M-ring protein FliF/YscJ
MARVIATGMRARVLAAGLCLLMLAGTAWLVIELAPSAPVFNPLSNGPMDELELAAAGATAEARGIPHRIENSRLLVPAEHLDSLRSAARHDGPAGGEKPLTFEQLAANSDIWTTQAQSAKRWQAAKMAELGRLISDFPGIRRATVIIEPGSGPGLGRGAAKPTAAVQIALSDGARVNQRLVGAIADLISGSVSGMEAGDVRIVDNAGRSYRVSAPAALDLEDQAEKHRRAEAYFTERAAAAIRYIDGAMVGVSVECDGGVERCIGASVSVPRSYLAAAYRAASLGAFTSGAPIASAGQTPVEPNDERPGAVAADAMERVRRQVCVAVGVESAEAVKVDWYYDVAPVAAAASQPAQPGAAQLDELSRDSDARVCAAAGCWAMAALGLWCGVLAIGRHRMLGRLEQSSSSGEPDSAGPQGASRGESESDDPLARLTAIDSEQLRAMLADEHPQTQALVLSQVPPQAAAEVLEGLGQDQQVEVSRRIAALGYIEPAVVAQAIGGLIEQWTSSPRHALQAPASGAKGKAGGQAYVAQPAVAAEQAGGVGKVARILNHTGGATERAVLDGLTGMAPALAESIRKRMFVFDDVALLPRTVLRSALESLGSDELAIALRTAGKAVTEKMLSSLPRDAAGKVRQEMERIGPVRLSDVEAAQERVVSAVRRLEGGLYTSSAGPKGSEVIA